MMMDPEVENVLLRLQYNSLLEQRDKARKTEQIKEENKALRKAIKALKERE